MENPGCVVVVVVVMDLGFCLLLCVMLPLFAHSHPCNSACGYVAQMLTHTQIFLKWFQALVTPLKDAANAQRNTS